MPTSLIADRTIETFERATAANRATACRTGNVVALDKGAGEDVVVSADLHGNRLNFERLLEIAKLDQRSERHLIMQEVCHGGPTYPGSDGCMSHLLLEDVAALKATYPDRFHFLLSNHEWAEMRDFPIMKSNRLLNLTFRTGLQHMYGNDTERVRTALTRFVASCPLAARIGNSTLVTHSAPDQVIELGFDSSLFQRELTDSDFAPHGDLFRLLWGRNFSAGNGAAFARLVDAQVLIHGHEPCEEGCAIPNSHQVILDCCSRRATYAVLPTAQCLSHSEVVDRVTPLWSC